MRGIIFTLFLTIMINGAFAREIKAGPSFKQTIKKSILVDDSKLDPVGIRLISLGGRYELQGNCEKRSEKDECTVMSFVLYYQNQKLMMVSAGDEHPQRVEINRIKENLDQKYLESLWRFQDFSKPKRQAGDFTGYIGFSCIWDNKTCGLLLLLPLAIAGDIVLLPVDIARNRIPQIKARNRAKKLIEGLSAPSDEERQLTDKEFFKIFESFSKIK